MVSRRLNSSIGQIGNAPSPSDPPSGGLSDRGSPASLSEPKASLEAGRLDSPERGQPVGPGRRGAILWILSCRAARKYLACRGELPARTLFFKYRWEMLQSQTQTLDSRFRGNDDVGLNGYAMMPPPRHTFDSYTTTDCPGVTAHCGAAKATSHRSASTVSTSHGASGWR